MPALERQRQRKGRSVGSDDEQHSNKDGKKGGKNFVASTGSWQTLPDTLPQLVDPTRRLQPSFNVGAQPLQALIKTVATRGTSGLQERECMSHERSKISNQGKGRTWIYHVR